jgi:hypothetical protein
MNDFFSEYQRFWHEAKIFSSEPRAINLDKSYHQRSLYKNQNIFCSKPNTLSSSARQTNRLMPPCYCIVLR